MRLRPILPTRRYLSSRISPISKMISTLELDEEEGEEEEGVEELREFIPNPTPETSDAHLESAEHLLRQAQLLD